MTLLSPDAAAIEAAVAPFVVQEWAAGDAEFEERTAALARRWRRRRRASRFSAWLPTHARLPPLLRGRRSQSFVRDSYTNTWSDQDWPNVKGHSDRNAASLAVWRGKGYLVLRGGLARSHMPVIAQAFEAVEPRSVLEVGSGMGLNLFTLSARFPGIAWTGVELTEAGVARGRSVQAEERLPEVIESYFPWSVSDLDAYRRIEFRQGDASKLPFETDSFDVVFTRQAVEQMKAVEHDALSEIARVAKHHAILVEPFADFNRSALNHDYLQAKDLASPAIDGLTRYGLEPVARFGGFPQKLEMGVGIAVCRVSGR